MRHLAAMNAFALLVAAVLAALSPARADPRASVMNELAPTGKLRIAIGVGPVASAFYCTRDPLSGRPRGVPVDLGNELSRMLGVPVEFVEYQSSGEITEAGKEGAWDVTFMPVDEQRAKAVEFGPAYYRFESSYLVPMDSPIKTIEDVDRPGVRVIGVDNTATGRAAAAALKKAKFSTFRSVNELQQELLAGRADAVALSRESLRSFAANVPGMRVLSGSFFQSRVAVAVPKGHKEALAFVSAFVENAKFTGSVRRALDGAGLKEAEVAPPATQKN
ncbi:MAG TPA: transporter substrate-binding domain-containing protein [Xanthobacteraceae bacterium]|nr:transporter substrate-binding domain-containing protein [Xanthobacteraceae bacterium]